MNCSRGALGGSGSALDIDRLLAVSGAAPGASAYVVGDLPLVQLAGRLEPLQH